MFSGYSAKITPFMLRENIEKQIRKKDYILILRKRIISFSLYGGKGVESDSPPHVGEKLFANFGE